MIERLHAVGTARAAGLPARFIVGAPRHIVLESHTKTWRKAAEAAVALLRARGIVLDELLGCGNYACAWSVEGYPAKVVKLTGDSSEAAAWTAVAAARARGIRLPALARTLGVWAMPHLVRIRGTPTHRRLWLVVQERLDKLPPAVVRYLNRVQYDIDGAAGIQPQWVTPERREQLREAVLTEARARFGTSGHRNARALITVMERLDGLGLHLVDVHGGNVMADRRTGAWRVMDLGWARVASADVPLLVDPLAPPVGRVVPG